MARRPHLVLALLVFALLVLGTTAARADNAFDWGQLVGAMTYCNLPAGNVAKIGRGLLAAAGLDADAAALARYEEGKAFALREMQKPGAATCAQVKIGYRKLLREVRR